MSLPPYIDRTSIYERLPIIFPEGVPQRTYCVREAAASTVFTMLYIGAVEGADIWAAPKQIVRMTDEQAVLHGDEDRNNYTTASMKPGFNPTGRRWYLENSREQIDLGDESSPGIVLVFVEVVATDGPVTEQRQQALLKVATEAGFSAMRVAFVTAYLDRSHAAFKKSVSELAWRSFAWFAAEPERLLVLHEGTEMAGKSLAQWL